MALIGAPAYSCLCSADSELYSNYLRAYNNWISLVAKNGRGIVGAGGRNRAGGVREIGGGCVDFGKCACGSVHGGAGWSSGRPRGVDVGPAVAGFVRDGRVGGGVGVAAESGEVRAAGLPSSPVDGRVGGLVDSSSDHHGETAAPGLGQQDALGVAGGSRGPNWERNRIWKEERKKKKERKQVDQGKKPGSGGGYFSTLPEDVQQELKQSRASLLIAQNKKRLAEIESPVGAVKKVMAALAVAAKAEKENGDAAIVGWAKTVTSSYAESVSKISGSTGSSKVCSAPTCSVSASSSVSVKDAKLLAKYGFERMPANAFESYVMSHGQYSSDALVKLRAKYGRNMQFSDLKADRMKVSPIHMLELMQQQASGDRRRY